MPLPGFFDGWSCPSSKVKKNFWLDATAAASAAAAVRDPTSWRAEKKRSRRRTAGALKIFQSFGGNKVTNSQQSTTKNNTGRARNVT